VNVFITGATGFVGREVLRHLDQAGHSIRILARDSNSTVVQEMVSTHQAEAHCGNVLDAGSLRGGLDGVDAVVHLVGIISEIGQNTFENIHTRGTKNMVEAARASGVKRFVQMSALGVRSDAVSRYHKSKWVAEEIVRRSGLDFTIFRPSIIYGAGDQFVNLFARMSRWSPILPVMGTGEGTLQPVRVEDVAQCFVNSLMDSRAVGQTYDLCGPEILTMPEILKTICAVKGRRRIQLCIPLFAARSLAVLLETVFPLLLRKAPPLNRDQLVMIEEKTIGDRRLAGEHFKIAPLRFRDGIEKYL